jgi:fluoroquinolone transport system ATP-binding protein
MIEVRNLRYRYRGAGEDSLRGVSFEIREGEIFGFLGPSGAGKSTTQKILIGLLQDYRGSVQVLGQEVRDWDTDYYNTIGVSFELPNHYRKLTAEENLNYFRALHGGKALPAKTVLSWVGLNEAARKPVAAFSKGMMVRLSVARSFLHRPRLLFLDEPTSGLDPVNARRMKDLIRWLRQEGTTVFVTTHNMHVAEELCDRVGFILNGSLSELDSPVSLKQRYGRRNVRVAYHDGGKQTEEREFALDGLGDNRAFIDLLKSARHIESIHSTETTLDSVFVRVTGEGLE